MTPIHRLSNELLRLILDHIEPDPDKTVPIDRRQFLSVESFDRPLPSSRGSLRDVGRFRTTCRRFADVGAPLLFTRVAARFSKGGLQRLEKLAGWTHLACHVKKFSYLVPYFYVDDSGHERAILLAVERSNLGVDLATLQRKAAEQWQILDSKEDLRVLKKAIASFTSLQQVQLLRVTDEEDDKLLTYIRQHADAPHAVDLEWARACSHGSTTIGTALLSANVPWSRFSSPMLSPQSAGFLASRPPRSLPTLAARLTCLTLHFDDNSDLDDKMRELSALFRTVFHTAEHMQAVHVGFPSHRPLSLPLEDVFHHVTWDKLVAFGIQGWKLDADEILNLALRHRDKLKGLRLRDVLLKEGSAWKDVLHALRAAMGRLEWVSLRRIGYVRHFEDLWLAAGAEVPDDPPPGESDSDSASDDDDPIIGGSGSAYNPHAPTNGHHHHHHHLPSHHHFDSDDDDSDDDSSAAASDMSSPTSSASSHGPLADALDFPALVDLPATPTADPDPDTPASTPWCSCDGRGFPDAPDALGDDGYSISNSERKAWEKWVVRRCPEHGER